MLLSRQFSMEWSIRRKALIDLLTRTVNAADNDFALESRSTMSLFPQMLASQRIPKWMSSGDFQAQNNASQLPRELGSILNSVPEQAYMTLGDFGIHCGQGLRSGANEFFISRLLVRLMINIRCSRANGLGEGERLRFPKVYHSLCAESPPSNWACSKSASTRNRRAIFAGSYTASRF